MVTMSQLMRSQRYQKYRCVIAVTLVWFCWLHLYNWLGETYQVWEKKQVYQANRRDITNKEEPVVISLMDTDLNLGMQLIIPDIDNSGYDDEIKVDHKGLEPANNQVNNAEDDVSSGKYWEFLDTNQRLLEEEPNGPLFEEADLISETDDILTEGKHAMFPEEENGISLLKENNDEEYDKIDLDELPVEKTQDANEQKQLTNHRIRWTWAGRCIDVVDLKHLIIAFCDPLSPTQTFDFSPGYMRHVYTGKCVRKADSGLSLELASCDKKSIPVSAEIGEDDTHFLKSTVDGNTVCLSPSGSKEGEPAGNQEDTTNLTASHTPCLGEMIHLTPCHEEASRVQLAEETWFQEDRKLLKPANLPNPGDECDFRACAFNRAIPDVVEVKGRERCTKLAECVTVIGKTARRPHLVLKLAASIRALIGDLPMIFVDDGPDDYPATTRDQLADYPLLQYIVSENLDLGIARGRNRALAHVHTKYVFHTDDDTVFLSASGLETMVRMLDTTDVTLVGGKFKNHGDFASFLQFGKWGGKRPKMGQLIGACLGLNKTVPNFPGCYKCELTSNLFTARTDILRDLVRGWSPELSVLEHKDFYIRLKAAGLKTVYCPDLGVYHARPIPEPEFKEKRRRHPTRYRHLTNNRWMINGVFPTKIWTIGTDGQVVFPDRQSGGFC